MNSKHGTSIKTELEPETFKPNLREPSDLLEASQIEKVQTVVPPCSNTTHPNLPHNISFSYVHLNVNQTLKDKVTFYTFPMDQTMIIIIIIEVLSFKHIRSILNILIVSHRWPDC